MESGRRQRHQVMRGAIIEAAWFLSSERGLGGWSLRDLAAEVGMRAPSLYVYFPSKDAIFDSMFGQGYRQLLGEARSLELLDDPRDVLRQIGRRFFAFAIADKARMQLMFWRVLPGFEPSAESYALSLEVSAFFVGELQRVGVDDGDAAEVWTALMIGVVTQQIANEPTGDSWGRHVDVVVDMFADRYLPG